MAVHKLRNNGLILIRNGKGFSGNDEFVSCLAKKEAILLAPNTRGEFRVCGSESQDGTSILINTKTGDVTLSSGIGNIFPIFYYFEDDLLIVGRSINSIVSELKLLKKYIPKLDIISVISSLLFDYPIGNHTYYENISKSEMGTQLVFQAEKRTIKKKILQVVLDQF